MGNCIGRQEGGGWGIEGSQRSFSRRADPWEKTGMVAFRSSNLRVSARGRGRRDGRPPWQRAWPPRAPGPARPGAFIRPPRPCRAHRHAHALSLAAQEFPKQVEPIAKKVRVLDGTDNKLTEVPAYVGLMAPCHRMGLSKNRLTSLPPGMAALTSLRVLLLDANRLRAVPPVVFQLASLERLNLAGNLLTELPKRVGHLKNLKQLDLSGNRLAELPRELGRCVALEELRVADNALARLPTDLAKLERLRLVVAENNAIDGVPPAVLRYCEALQTLALHGNPVTLEALEATDGFAEFEARRVAKWDKSLAAGVLLGSTRMDEAAERAGGRAPGSPGAGGGGAPSSPLAPSPARKQTRGKQPRGKVKSHHVPFTTSVDTA